MAVTIYNEVALDKLGEFKQKIVEGSGLSNEDTDVLKEELKNTQNLCRSLGIQLTQTKLDVIKKDDVISGLGKQQANIRMELIKLQKELN